MPDPVVERAQAWLREHEEDLLRDTLEMLQIASIEGEAGPNAPFGPENRQALDLALQLASDYGMKTTDLEGYIGFGEFGEGKPLIVSLGHLDVVPTGPGWKHDPFGAEIDGGYIYARGAEDDKGPTMASFYAMRAILETSPDLGVRFRQVFGCNEESGFACVERYVKTEEPPTYGIAPDSGWPLYHAEKGIANLDLHVRVPNVSMRLLELEGGQRPNIVIDSCSAKVQVDASARAEVEAKLADAWDLNVTFAWDGDTLGIFAVGKAAHGSTPFHGDSAAIRAMRFLKEITPLDGEPFYNELFESAHIGGAGLGIAGSDAPSRDLTCNLGIVNVADGLVELLYNIRYPVTWTGQDLEARCRAFLAGKSSEFELKVVRDSPPLYFPLEHPMVAAIVDAYEEETGERREPGTMGGGTYARAIPNTVSVGTGWDGDGKAHETDERLKVEHLFKMSRIYVNILVRLARLASGS
jgi:succinyl-diaminopimelate desuccinylase